MGLRVRVGLVDEDLFLSGLWNKTTCFKKGEKDGTALSLKK